MSVPAKSTFLALAALGSLTIYTAGRLGPSRHQHVLRGISGELNEMNYRNKIYDEILEINASVVKDDAGKEGGS